MKARLYDSKGKETGSIELPKNFSARMREDILLKVFETLKGVYSQPYGAKKGAGAQYSASGILKKKRHDWKATYGKGISRVPRKIISRHGASFNWIGATVSSTRGGRRPHAPRAEKNPFKKINKKEFLIALNSAFAGTVNKDFLEKKYSKKLETGAIFSKEILTLKTKDFLSTLKKVLGEETLELAMKKKKIRAGIGKMRGRKYKSSAGMLFIIADDETMKRNRIDIVKVNELTIKDLSPNGEPGRITCYTKKAIEQIRGNLK